MLKNLRAFTKRTTAILAASLMIVSFGGPGLQNKEAEAISNQAMIELINGQRTAHDLGSLRWNAELSSSAWLKAQDMCDRDYWSHTNPDGEKAWGLIAAEGYDYRFVGENLAKGYDTESQIVDAWMESTTHRETMLNPVYEDVGYAQIRCEFQGTERIVAVSHYGTLH
mgnify:CR=1 FL=1